MSKKVAVVLAGCGVFDGAEINEVVLSLLSLEQQGASYQCFAPDMEQMHVINHLTGEVVEGESRNVLQEAARIVRGNVKPLSEARAEQFDALLVPGGFGVAKNLSDFAINGPEATVQADFLALAQAFRDASKPIGLVCIAPALTGKIFGAAAGAVCTVGNDVDVAAAIEQTGASHRDCPVNEAVVDRENKLVTTPAYMLAGSISEAATGIQACVSELLAL